MPTRDSEDSTGDMNRGNFVHKVLEIAVNEKITSKGRLYEIRDMVAKEPDFRGVDIEIATAALDVFWERNKNRIEIIDYKTGKSEPGPDEKAVDTMIEITKKIAFDYEHGFGRTKDENTCGECG